MYLGLVEELDDHLLEEPVLLPLCQSRLLDRVHPRKQEVFAQVYRPEVFHSGVTIISGAPALQVIIIPSLLPHRTQGHLPNLEEHLLIVSQWTFSSVSEDEYLVQYYSQIVRLAAFWEHLED